MLFAYRANAFVIKYEIVKISLYIYGRTDRNRDQCESRYLVLTLLKTSFLRFSGRALLLIHGAALKFSRFQKTRLTPLISRDFNVHPLSSNSRRRNANEEPTGRSARLRLRLVNILSGSYCVLFKDVMLVSSGRSRVLLKDMNVA